MELCNAFMTRRSTRRYAQDPVTPEKIEEMLDLAATAPSACNRRGWRCILVQNRKELEWLYLHGGSAVLQDTGQALLVCYEAQTENREWADNIQSAAAFIAYFQLIAHDNGIGSCWICHLPPKREVSEHFGIPPEYTPVAVISFGLYREESHLQIRDNAKQAILSVDRWHFDAGEDENFKGASQFRTLLRKIYYTLPFRGWLRHWAGRYEKKFDE